MRQPLDLLGQPVGIEPLDRRRDPTVKLAPTPLEEAPVGDLVREGVLEGVLEVGEEPGLVEELRGLQVGQRQPECGVGQLRDRLKLGEGDVLADH